MHMYGRAFTGGEPNPNEPDYFAIFFKSVAIIYFGLSTVVDFEAGRFFSGLCCLLFTIWIISTFFKKK